MLIEFKSKAGDVIFVDSSPLTVYELEPGLVILIYGGHQQGVQGTIRDVVAKLSPALRELSVASTTEEERPVEISGKKRG